MLFLCSALSAAGLKLDPPLGDHAVLQRDREVVVRGTAHGVTRVVVKLAGAEAAVEVRDGAWEARLPALGAGGPYELVASADGAEVRARDILVGEVWLCSGQSNMEMPLGPINHTPEGTTDWKEEAAAANFPEIRQFKIEPALPVGPVARVRGKWTVCAPDTVPKFSAVAYYMAKAMHARLRVPVGIVNSSLGGTPSEAWSTPDSLAATRELANVADEFVAKTKEAEAARADFAARKDEIMARHQERVAAAQAAGKKSPGPPQPPALPVAADRPSTLYWGMIQPIEWFQVRGVAWYQGEANSKTQERAELYRVALRALIDGWRAKRGESSLPFLIVEIAPHSRWKEPVRANQLAVVQERPPAALIRSDDIVDASIHPPLKRPTGDRLAEAAFGLVYFPGEKVGEKVVLSSGAR